MSKIAVRIRRIERATHTWVTPEDWQLIADRWKEALNRENAKPDEFKSEVDEFSKKVGEILADTILTKQFYNDFAQKNRPAYYAYRYFSVVEIIRTNPRGMWMKNSYKHFFDTLRDLRIEARRQENN